MPKYDNYIEMCIKSENESRIKHFLANTDKVLAQATPENSTNYKERSDALKQEIKQANDTINQMNEESRAKKNRDHSQYGVDAYNAQIIERFPELADPRCFTHAMRPVPMEHMRALYDNTDGMGTKEYLKLRWDVPPNQRFYFRATTNWDYGWFHPDPSNEPYYGHTTQLNSFIWRKNTLAMFVKDKQIAVKKF